MNIANEVSRCKFEKIKMFTQILQYLVITLGSRSKKNMELNV